MKPWLIGSIAVVVAFAAGSASMWAYQHFQQPGRAAETVAGPVSEKQTQEFLDDIFDDDFFKANRDPFAEIARMHKHMNQMFPNDQFASGFDHWLDQNDGSIEYEIDVDQKDLVDLSVNVENGYVAIDGKMRNQGEHQYSESQFSQRFPIPANADPDSVKVEKQSDKVVIHFDKLNA